MDRRLDHQIANEMNRLKADFRLMGDLVCLGLTDAMEALRDANLQKGYRVILRDSDIDTIESRIDRHCLEFLTKFTPAGSNLRFIFTAVKMSSEIERVGDYAETIARQAVELSYSPGHPILGDLTHLSEIALSMFQWAIQAFLEGDEKKARLTIQREQEVDALESRIYSQLMSGQFGEAEEARRIFSLLTIANRIERVADQACNICEEVVYMTTGNVLKHHHDRQFRVLFLSESNACRSLMAEAIGKKLSTGTKFHFFSAGSQPSATLDSRAEALLRERGVPTEGLHPKGISQVQPLRQFDVIVSFRDGAAVAPPRPEYKHFSLTWSLPPPQGAHHEGLVYEKTFDQLQTRIRDLMLALSP